MVHTGTSKDLRTRTRELDNEIEKVQVKLQALAEVLNLFGKNISDVTTEGVCDLVSGGIDNARSMLCDISEHVQMLAYHQPAGE